MAEPTHSSEGAEIPKEKAGSVLSFVVLLVGDEFRKSSFEGPGEDLQFYAVTSCWKLLSGGFDLN